MSTNKTDNAKQILIYGDDGGCLIAREFDTGEAVYSNSSLSFSGMENYYREIAKKYPTGTRLQFISGAVIANNTMAAQDGQVICQLIKSVSSHEHACWTVEPAGSCDRRWVIRPDTSIPFKNEEPIKEPVKPATPTLTKVLIYFSEDGHVRGYDVNIGILPTSGVLSTQKTLTYVRHIKALFHNTDKTKFFIYPSRVSSMLLEFGKVLEIIKTAENLNAAIMTLVQVENPDTGKPMLSIQEGWGLPQDRARALPAHLYKELDKKPPESLFDAVGMLPEVRVTEVSLPAMSKANMATLIKSTRQNVLLCFRDGYWGAHDIDRYFEALTPVDMFDSAYDLIQSFVGAEGPGHVYVLDEFLGSSKFAKMTRLHVQFPNWFQDVVKGMTGTDFAVHQSLAMKNHKFVREDGGPADLLNEVPPQTPSEPEVIQQPVEAPDPFDFMMTPEDAEKRVSEMMQPVIRGLVAMKDTFIKDSTPFKAIEEPDGRGGVKVVGFSTEVVFGPEALSKHLKVLMGHDDVQMAAGINAYRAFHHKRLYAYGDCQFKGFVWAEPGLYRHAEDVCFAVGRFADTLSNPSVTWMDSTFGQRLRTILKSDVKISFKTLDVAGLLLDHSGVRNGSFLVWSPNPKDENPTVYYVLSHLA